MKWLATKLKGWKTIAANVVFAIVPIMELTEVRDVIPNEYLPAYSLAIVLANLWLRSVTTTAVGKKG